MFPPVGRSRSKDRSVSMDLRGKVPNFRQGAHAA
jgi:hypothetical protein